MPNQPIYVTGMMESGKSTLMSLLDGHPDLLVFPQEPHFGRMLEQHFASTEEARHWSLEESPFGKQGRLLGIEDQQDNVFDHDKYRALLDQALDTNCAARNVMIETVRAFAEATGQNFTICKYWVFNEPNRARLAPWFFATFPKGRVIHLLRDPREHFRAVKAHHHQAQTTMGTSPAVHFSMDWSLVSTQALENRDKFGAERYLLLRYEDIGDDREKSMRRVSRFLGIEFDPAFMLASKVGVSAPSPAERISESDIGNWLRPLSRRERLVIESCCTDFMDHADINYPTHTPSTLLRITRELISRAVYGHYYGKRFLKGITLPPALHELHRIDRATLNSRAFRL